MESESGATTIVLEDNIYDEYFYLRTFEGKDIPHGDSIEFKFKDGLLGFKIYESHIFIKSYFSIVCSHQKIVSIFVH